MRTGASSALGQKRNRGAHVHWLILERTQIDLCLTDPGFEVDLHVNADLRAFVRVWLGDVPFSTVVGAGHIQLVGSRELVRAFPSWLLLSHFAEVRRPADDASSGDPDAHAMLQHPSST